MLNGQAIPMPYGSVQDELAIADKFFSGLEFITNVPDYGGVEEVNVGCWYFGNRAICVAKLNIWSCNYRMGSINKWKFRRFIFMDVLLYKANLQCPDEMRFHFNGTAYFSY